MGDAKFEFVMYGYNEFKTLMKQAAPDLRKEMDKTIRDFLKDQVAKPAKDHYVPPAPLRNWTKEPEPREAKKGEKRPWNGYRVWQPEQVRKGIVVRQGGRQYRGSITRTAWRIANRNAAGSIFELAGRSSNGKTPQGRAFIANLNRTRKPSRVIWAAWDKAGGERVVSRHVAETIHEFDIKLQERLDNIDRRHLHH